MFKNYLKTCVRKMNLFSEFLPEEKRACFGTQTINKFFKHTPHGTLTHVSPFPENDELESKL